MAWSSWSLISAVLLVQDEYGKQQVRSVCCSAVALFGLGHVGDAELRQGWSVCSFAVVLVCCTRSDALWPAENAADDNVDGQLQSSSAKREESPIEVKAARQSRAVTSMPFL